MRPLEQKYQDTRAERSTQAVVFLIFVAYSSASADTNVESGSLCEKVHPPHLGQKLEAVVVRIASVRTLSPDIGPLRCHVASVRNMSRVHLAGVNPFCVPS